MGCGRENVEVGNQWQGVEHMETNDRIGKKGETKMEAQPVGTERYTEEDCSFPRFDDA